MNERGRYATAVGFKWSEKPRYHLVEKSVFHDVDFLASTMCGLLDFHDPYHCFGEPRLPRSLPPVVAWDIAQVGGYVEAELASRRFASRGVVELGYDRDNRVDTRHLVLKVMEGAEVEPPLWFRCIVTPCKGSGNVGRNVLMED